MLKEALIKIKGTQCLGEESDITELTTFGKFGIKNGSYFISYDESELSGMKNVKTGIFVRQDDTVVIKRTGELESTLEVENGKRSMCFYNTDAGILEIGVFGEKVINGLSLNGGTLKMEYNIDSNLRLISKNTVEITVREVN